ncbi:hypothetical protein AGMMS49992_28260 [Clostridia bacterium]|nr:hypothetical protein AGMMS49992_28260 [Clostridia bacterium]
MELQYKFTSDILFKMLFVKHPGLLLRLVAKLLNIQESSISEFRITNREMPPELMGDKFCRLDITMIVNGQLVNLEIQVKKQGDYPERSLYNWARFYSNALKSGDAYMILPRVVVINIVAFHLFAGEAVHSEFEVLEVNRHTRLTDRLSMHYYELQKLPEAIDADDAQQLWLQLFNAQTTEELTKLEALEVPDMKEAIGAYRYVTALPEYQEYERLREIARHNEASALLQAKLEAREESDAKWQTVVADKDAEIAKQRAQLSGHK